MEGLDPERVRRIERAVAYMKNHLGLPLPLSDLAGSVPFSRFHFVRVFREVTGLTPGRFLAALRIAEARRLLLHSSLAVGVIGPQVGYASVGTFTTQFSRLVGISPERFRRVARTAARRPRTVLGPAPVRGPGLVIGPEPWRPGERLVVAWRPTSGGAPVESCLAAERGPVAVPLPPDGRHYRVRVLLLGAGARPVDALVEQRPDSFLVGEVNRTLTAATATGDLSPVRLRRPRVTDPPLLSAGPLISMSGQSDSVEYSA
jgi:AraC-like DNA-binding protein